MLLISLLLIYVGSKNETFMPVSIIVTGACMIVVGIFQFYATSKKWEGINGRVYGKHSHTTDADARIGSYICSVTLMVMSVILLVLGILLMV